MESCMMHFNIRQAGQAGEASLRHQAITAAAVTAAAAPEAVTAASAAADSNFAVSPAISPPTPLT